MCCGRCLSSSSGSWPSGYSSRCSDIFRREDLSEWGKGGWIFLIFVLPFLGVLIYMIARPRMTEQDRPAGRAHDGARAARRAAGYSATDEAAKLAALRDGDDGRDRDAHCEDASRTRSRHRHPPARSKTTKRANWPTTRGTSPAIAAMVTTNTPTTSAMAALAAIRRRFMHAPNSRAHHLAPSG
jgi:Phospholipase_D-nuclease N-terminal